jgi:hypothetical protein
MTVRRDLLTAGRNLLRPLAVWLALLCLLYLLASMVLGMSDTGLLP